MLLDHTPRSTGRPPQIKEEGPLVDGVLVPDSPLQGNVIRLTKELTETAKSVRALVDLLERDPQSLLFGKSAKDEKK